MTKQRPNPEKLLRVAQEEERHHLQGKLKIYLGAAPGVGKTYSMLQDAVAKQLQGLDVLIGIVETHGRKDLEELLKPLAILPRQTIDYRGQQLTEFDLDAALARNPALILIDEMAHTNVLGLRHAKRWQDIKEILDRGIDVYTTLNVQHIESLNHVVSQIVHAQIKETVPDSMLELADTIELIDLPPEELLKRLQDGKVYIPKQAELAVEHFFRKGNLIALRELALRITADRVNAQVLMYREGMGIKHIWPTKDKLLVCVGYKAESMDIIRATRRLAVSLQAEWIAVHIETPRFQVSEEQRNSVIANLRLAEQLGAETKVLVGLDLVEEVINFSRERNITTIVVGKIIRPRWKKFFFSSLADELVRHSGEIDVYIITFNATTPKALQSTPVTKIAASWRIYAISLGMVALLTAINYFLFPYLKSSSLILMYLLGVAIVAMFGRRGPSFLASVLSVLCYDFFFIPPYYSFFTVDMQYLFTLFDMLFVALVISHFAILSRRQAEAARLAEHYAVTQHMFTRQLASTRGVDKLLESAVCYVAKIFDSEVLALLPDKGHLKIHTKEGGGSYLSEKERGVAQWVYDLGQIAGWGTDTLPFSDSIYVPLLASQGAIGVLRVHPINPQHFFTPEQMHLLESCANQVALAMEVDRLHQVKHK